MLVHTRQILSDLAHVLPALCDMVDNFIQRRKHTQDSFLSLSTASYVSICNANRTISLIAVDMSAEPETYLPSG